MPTQVTTSIRAVVMAQLYPGEDLLDALKAIVRDNQIRAGIVLSITGALDCAVLQRYKDGQVRIATQEITERMEASGSGILGTVVAPGRGREPFGIGQYVDGEPYVHVHLTVSTASTTVCGHLQPGCRVLTTDSSGAPAKKSHFTLMVGILDKASLEMRLDESGVHHEIAPLP